eukprot:CAMPEP_0196576900 /NCGR_PEP_ID=MMETSP1081-20130531/6059_1 /TAXON_ID=36882 /ORGANISM="Pyramimonas amylifera, Strain CCMP720" /LENGTH=178 /DNA_ID=CAMNT_0041895633 /DNA_START=98 /DNA_END=631 /DNA_ORIENTATION=-
MNATRLFFVLKGDFNAKSDTVEAANELNSECDGVFETDLKPTFCVSVMKMSIFLTGKWIPGREPLSQEVEFANPPIPAGFIENGHFFSGPTLKNFHRSVMADFTAYLLSRPRDAVPPPVRKLLLYKSCCWKTCICNTDERWPGSLMPRFYYMPDKETVAKMHYNESDIEEFVQAPGSP